MPQLQSSKIGKLSPTGPPKGKWDGDRVPFAQSGTQPDWSWSKLSSWPLRGQSIPLAVRLSDTIRSSELRMTWAAILP